MAAGADKRLRNLYISAATYTPVLPSVALWFLESILEGILVPAISDAEAEFTLRWHRIDRTRMSMSSVDAQIWDRVRNEFPLAWIALGIWKESNRAKGRNPAIAGATVHFSRDPERASSLEFSVNVGALGGGIGQSIQTKVVELSLATFSKVKGIVGFITVDFVSASVYGSMSPYERAIGLAYPESSRRFLSKARGYYWGNLLYRSHIELLGGPSVLSMAPAYLTKAVDPERYYIQLTDDINRIDRDKLAHFKELFAPILPDGFPQSPEYYQSLPDFLL